MSTYTKKTVIVWRRDTYESGMLSKDGTAPTGDAFNEFNDKTLQMIADGVMSEEGDVIVKRSKITSIKFFTDEVAAQKWIEFNDTLAAKYGFKKISSVIQDA